MDTYPGRDSFGLWAGTYRRRLVDQEAVWMSVVNVPKLCLPYCNRL